VPHSDELNQTLIEIFEILTLAHNIREFYEAKMSINIQQNLYLSEVCELILMD